MSRGDDGEFFAVQACQFNAVVQNLAVQRCMRRSDGGQQASQGHQRRLCLRLVDAVNDDVIDVVIPKPGINR